MRMKMVGRRHTKVIRAEVVTWHRELARRILLPSTPTPAGDKPLASRSLRLALRSLRPRYNGLGEIVADFSTDVSPRGIRAWIPAYGDL